MNGTYVNDVKIDERCNLKHNDVIGLGCSEIALNGPEEDLPVKREDMYVYRLIKKTENLDLIEISDDDEDDGGKDVKPVISNGVVKTEPAVKTNDASRLVTNSSPRRRTGMLVFSYITSSDLFFFCQ